MFLLLLFIIIINNNIIHHNATFSYFPNKSSYSFAFSSHTHIDIDGRFALLSIHINGTKKKGSHIETLNTPSQFDAEVRASFKKDKAEVFRYGAYLDFASEVQNWITYCNFGSTSSTSAHAIAQGCRDPQVLHMHFFKDNDQVTRMKYRLN